MSGPDVEPPPRRSGMMPAYAVPIGQVRTCARPLVQAILLISNRELGKALAEALGQNTVALIRGHGNAVVATSGA